MRYSSANREATTLQHRVTTGAVNVAEGLNPRGGIIKPYEMSIRRSETLDKICARHLQLCEGDHHLARTTRPWPVAGGGFEAPTHAADLRRWLKTTYGDTFYRHPDIRHHWPTVYDQWLSGSLARSRNDLIANLPQSVQDKLASD